MSRSEPRIEVGCDYARCEAIVEIGLTTTGRGYDERNILTDLEAEGWTVVNGEDRCPDHGDPDPTTGRKRQVTP